MKCTFGSWILTLAALGGIAIAEETKTKPSSASPGAPAAAASAPAPKTKLESFVLLPEPKEMRTSQSLMLPDAKTTVFTAAREVSGTPGVRTYEDADFAKLGISLETFLQRARTAADRRLAELTPELIKDDSGRLRYVVFRGESPLNASLVVAPSLGALFHKALGDPIWAVLPDRHSLYLFPSRPDALAEFTSDLRDRYDSDPFAASAEIYEIKSDGSLPRVVGAFAD